jgi:hypothetical protein
MNYSTERALEVIIENGNVEPTIQFFHDAFIELEKSDSKFHIDEIHFGYLVDCFIEFCHRGNNRTIKNFDFNLQLLKNNNEVNKFVVRLREYGIAYQKGLLT